VYRKNEQEKRRERYRKEFRCLAKVKLTSLKRSLRVAIFTKKKMYIYNLFFILEIVLKEKMKINIKKVVVFF
jgi:hypothetical protein